MKNKVIEIFDAIGVDTKSVDFEDCHRVGKSKNNSKKVVARFVNRKVVKNVLYKRKQLRTIDKTFIGLHNATIFLNENLTPENNKTAYHCRKLKRDGTISYAAILLKMGNPGKFIMLMIFAKCSQTMTLEMMITIILVT